MSLLHIEDFILGAGNNPAFDSFGFACHETVVHLKTTVYIE